MYDFIYYYFYKLIIKRNPDAKFNAAALMFLIIGFHIAFPFAILKKVFDLSYDSFGFSDTYLINKLYMMPFGVAFLILTYYIFKRRFEKIERKYEGRKMVTFWNTVIVFSIMLVPLIITIILLKKE